MGASIFRKLVLIGIIGLIPLWTIVMIRETVDASIGLNKLAAQVDTPTNTPLPPTASSTPLPPTATETPLPPTATETPLPPTATETPLPPTATETPLPPTSTNTPAPPTATNTASPRPTNRPPTISAIADRFTSEDVPTGFSPFVVADSETPAEELVISAASTNTTLVPAGNIKIGGSGSNRSIKLIPAPNKHGTTTITLTVSDGRATSKSSFNLTVKPINDPPLIDLNGSDPGTDFSVLFITNDEAVKIADNDLEILDIDSVRLTYATIIITNPLDGAAEVLTAVTDGTDITASFAAGVLSLNGSDTIAHYLQVLKSITYHNSAVQPDAIERRIQFVLNDGLANSNVAISTVNIVDPQLAIIVSPDTQTITRGGSAAFTIEVQNTGNISLNDVTVRDPLAPDCERNLGTMEADEIRKYSCNQRNINREFTNVASVLGQDAQGHDAFDDDSARVEVENPNIQIVKSPSSQARMKGEPAIFDIFIINTSKSVDLENVEVHDPLVPDCNRTGIQQFNNLPAGQDVLYQCQLENVSAAFTNVITATGTNLLTGQSVQDSSVANIELLDLSASLKANPVSLPASGGPVTFTLTISNLGSVAVTPTSLYSDNHGPLLHPDNPQLINNECSSQTLPSLGTAEQFVCTFSGMIDSKPPYKEVAVLVEAQYNDKNTVSHRTSIRIAITNPIINWSYFPLTAHAYLPPYEDNDLPCQAYKISTDRTHYFIPEDLDDWYYFDILKPGKANVHLEEFLPIDGQLAIWQGSSCKNLDTLVGHNANFLRKKEVPFYANPGRYYVWVTNSDNTAYDSPYSLYIDAP